jgi:transglutaminase-like putative cysteine protease
VQFPTPEEGLVPTDVIDSDHPVVRQTADRVAGDADGAEAVGRLFDYVRDALRYDMAPVLDQRSDWTASSTIERGYGFCQQKAVALAALLRARGVPSGVAAEDLLDHRIPPPYVEHMGSQVLPFHGFTIAYVDGEWRRLDATLDRALCERKNYRIVEYEPGRDCVLPPDDRAGLPHFEHLVEHGRWADLPHEVVDEVLALDYLRTESWRSLGQRTGPGM